MNSSYDPDLFAGTAEYYARYRLGYPSDALELLATEFHLSTDAPVMDLGCGSGQLAIPIARRGIPVAAIDPDPEMLMEGIRIAPAFLPICWLRATDHELSLRVFRSALPKIFRLVVMGASFHWMNRDAVLISLDALVDGEGGVAVMSSSDSSWRGGDWEETTRQVVAEFLGPLRRAGSSTYEHPKDRHEVVLARSPFSLVDVRHFTMQRSLTIDEVVGLQLSMSFSSPRLLGERLKAFQDTLRKRLGDLNPSGVFDGELSFEVILARRP